MISRTTVSLRKHPRILDLMFIMVAVFASSQTSALFAYQSSPAAEQERSDAETIHKLKIASMQHDLILLLIENKDFDRVEPEWRKVLDLRLGAKYEGAVAQSLLAISYKLYEAKQLTLAQKILDESLSSVTFSNKSKADILRFKAYLYKETGNLDRAIETLKQAGELAEKP